MKTQSLLLPAVFAAVVLAAPAVELAPRATTTPTVYLIGDSTMAKGGGGTGTQGRYPPSTPVTRSSALKSHQVGANTSPTPSPSP